MDLSNINSVLRETVVRISEEATYTVDGQKGVWRTVRGNRIFFPKGNGSPVGMPSAMKGKGLGGSSGSGGSSGFGVAGSLSSKESRKKTLAPKKAKMDKAASSAAKKVAEAASSGGTRDATGRFIKDGKGGGGSSREIGSGAAKKAMSLGLGAALLGMFPAVLGHVMVALIAKSAAKAIGKRLRRFVESEMSRKEQLRSAIEGGLRDAIRMAVDGEMPESDIEKALAYAKKKGRGEGENV